MCYNNIMNDMNREKVIIKTSVIGIVANLFLSVFKIIVGTVSNSIAITLDAVNNISDAASSVITIVGAKLANAKPNKKHPFGHGRTEYLSAMLIAIIILYAGITSLRQSVMKIIEPEEVNYTIPSLIIIGVAVIVKIVLGIYVKSVGEKVNSDSLINSGEDAKFDAIISLSTLVAAIIFLKTKISVEAYLGAIISLIIIKSGVGMLKDTISSILGESGDAEILTKIREVISGFDEVKGVHDIIINDYGPEKWMASVHIELADTLTANEIDKLTRDITSEVYKKCNVVLTAVGIYSLNTRDEDVISLRKDVTQMILSNQHAMQVHGFYYDKESKTLRFDVVMSFDAVDREKEFNEIVENVKNKYSDYKIIATLDTEF